MRLAFFLSLGGKSCVVVTQGCVFYRRYPKGWRFFMKSCCFIGHRTIENPKKVKTNIWLMVMMLLAKGYDTFYFGSRSQFDDLCHEVVTEFKQKYPNLKRVYVRAEYPKVNKEYTDYLSQNYEDSFYADCLKDCGKLSYVIRNRMIIDASDWCVFYYNPDYEKTLNGAKSGTKLAYEYALHKGKHKTNLFIE